MTALVDVSGVALELAHPPRRIVALIPSTTETLCRLGLSEVLPRMICDGLSKTLASRSTLRLLSRRGDDPGLHVT